MSDIWNQNAGVAINPDEITSFAGAGQMYNAVIFGGFNVSAERVNPLFTFRRGDGSVVNSELLTNLDEAAKIGSTMSFLATHVAFRVIPTAPTAALTPDTVEAMKHLLASAVIELNYGSNKTNIGEFSGLHSMAPVDFAAVESTGNSTAANAGMTGSNWIKLSEKIQIQKNLNISGTVKFGATVPTALTTVANSFAFIVMLYGIKRVDA